MSLNCMDKNEMDLFSEFCMHCFSSSDPLPKWWSGTGTQYHYHRFFYKKLREFIFTAGDIF